MNSKKLVSDVVWVDEDEYAPVWAILCPDHLRGESKKLEDFISCVLTYLVFYVFPVSTNVYHFPSIESTAELNKWILRQASRTKVDFMFWNRLGLNTLIVSDALLYQLWGEGSHPFNCHNDNWFMLRTLIQFRKQAIRRSKINLPQLYMTTFVIHWTIKRLFIRKLVRRKLAVVIKLPIVLVSIVDEYI